MANNRMYITCVCGKSLFLGKSMGEGYYTQGDLSQRYDKFMEEHWICGSDTSPIGGVTYFCLTYEHATDAQETPG